MKAQITNNIKTIFAIWAFSSLPRLISPASGSVMAFVSRPYIHFSDFHDLHESAHWIFGVRGAWAYILSRGGPGHFVTGPESSLFTQSDIIWSRRVLN